MTNEFLFYMLQNFSQTCLFSEEREVHLQYCSSPCLFWFSPDVACLVSWLSCLFIATALLSHFHFPICTQHSWPASLQKCAPKTFPYSDFPPSYCFWRERATDGLNRGSWKESSTEQFPLTDAHDLSIKILCQQGCETVNTSHIQQKYKYLLLALFF